MEEMLQSVGYKASEVSVDDRRGISLLKINRDSLEEPDDLTEEQIERLGALMTLLSQDESVLLAQDEVSLGELLSEAAGFGSNPIVMNEMQGAVDLMKLSLDVLSRSEECSAIDVPCLMILVEVFEIPGALEQLDTEFMSSEILGPKTEFIMKNRETVPKDLVMCVLQLMLAMSKPPLTFHYFGVFSKFIRFCIDENAHVEIVALAFRLGAQHYRSLYAWENWVKHGDFLRPSFTHLGRKHPVTFGPVCEFLGSVTLNNDDMRSYVPDHYMIVHRDLLKSLEVSEQMLCFLRYLHCVVLTPRFCQMFMEKEFVLKLIDLIEGGGTFAVSKEAAKIFDDLTGAGSVRWLEHILVEYGTIDFFVRFFETRDTDLIMSVMNTLASIANSMFRSDQWTPMVAVLQNSTTLFDTIMAITEGTYPEFTENEYELTATLEESFALVESALAPAMRNWPVEPVTE